MSRLRRLNEEMKEAINKLIDTLNISQLKLLRDYNNKEFKWIDELLRTK